MSQTSKQISKPLFCLRLQSEGREVGAAQGPFHRRLRLTLLQHGVAVHGDGHAEPLLQWQRAVIPFFSPSWRNASYS